MTTPSIQALPLAGKRFTGDGASEPIVVRSPYDGSTVGAVPMCTAADVDRAVAVAAKALRESPLPCWKRARRADRAAVALAEQEERFARIIAAEAAKPLLHRMCRGATGGGHVPVRLRRGADVRR